MEFRILGSLDVRAGDRAVTPAGAKPRTVLAMLLLHANEPVSADHLAMALWGEEAPAGASKALQVHVSRLRRALGEFDVIGTTPAGYTLRVLEGELDAHRFQQLAAEGRRALADGAPDRAARLLREALSLWRGPALADVALDAFAQTGIERLEEERLAALESRVEADLALGRHAELAGELAQLAAAHPLRERLHASLMLALYRAGRQAEALEAYRAARGVLVEELGIEPGPELRDLERAILAHDAAIQAPAGPPRPARIPAALTPTLGRELDVRELVDWLGRDEVRLVTLTGPGGVGKTRLSIEVARAAEARFRDGAWLVSLASTTRAEHVASAIAQALEAMPSAGETPADAIARFLAPKHALVVLDNLEHVLEAAPIVPELLSRCPGLKLLATSREALRVEPEHRFAVAPLAVPADGRPAAVESSAAGALFFERARRHDGGFALTDGNAAAVAEICRRLDGLPLAIELAAARTPLLSPEELSRRLAHSLDILGPGGRDAPPRQRTLRAAIDWSYRLLSPEEARAFARFAVFAGGATIEAAEYVTQADLGVLEGLVEKHLLERRQDAAGATRLVILETLRQFAAEHLDAEVRRRHCRYYVELAAQAEPALWTIAEAEWLARLDAEIGNLRAALDWSVGAGDPLGLRLAGLLAEYWDIRGFAGEGLQWLREAFETAGDAAPLQDRARARRAQAKLLEEQGSLEDPELREQGRAYASDALAMARETGDAAAIAAALLLLCHAEAEPGFPKRRRHALAEEALDHARRAGDRRLIAWALKDAALALAPAEAEAELQEAIAAMRQIGAARSLAMLYNSAAYSAIKAGDLQRARALLDQSEPLTLELDDPMLLAAVSGNAGLAALFAGRLDEARFAFEQQLDICLRLVIPWLASEGLAGLAAIAAREGDLERAARVLGAAGAHGPIGDAEVIARLERDFFAPAQESLGDELWRRSHTAGAGLGLADAVDLASAARRAAVHTHD